jgi:dihydrofolate reductase
VLTVIVARARNGAIGKDNTIPWSAPEDLAFFQRETTGGALIMGRNTWDSLPVRPLKGRLNLVVSGTMPASETVCRSVPEAIARAEAQGYRRLYGIGGARIYRDTLALADRLLITEVDLEVADADALFPAVDDADWRCVGSVLLRHADPRCKLREYLRRN